MTLSNRPIRPYPKPAPRPKKTPKPIKQTKTTMQPGFDRAGFIRERGIFCECACGERATDVHHALLPRMKNVPQCDDFRNLAYVEHYEHTQLKKFDNMEWRRYFFILNCGRYGKDKMIEWIESLPIKVRSRLDFLKPLTDGKE